MPIVKLCGYLTQIDKFNQFHIKFCDDRDDKKNTQYKLFQLRKTGGDNPVKENKFVVKSKKSAPAFEENVPVEAKKLIGSLVEVTCKFQRYSFDGNFGWSLHLQSIKTV